LQFQDGHYISRMKEQLHGNNIMEYNANNDIILEFMDGQRIEAALTKPFNPEEIEVELLIGNNKKKQTFLLQDACCVLLKNHQNWLHLFQKGISPEAVTTSVGNTYHVNVPYKKSHASGFFGLISDDNTPYRLIFFTNAGVKTRCQTRGAGEVIKAEVMASNETVQKVVEGPQKHKKRLTFQIIEENENFPRIDIDKAIAKVKKSGKAVQKVMEEQEELKKHLTFEIIEENKNLPDPDADKTIAEATKSGKFRLRARVGEILIRAGLVTKDQIEQAREHQAGNRKKKIGEFLIEQGLITEDQLLMTLAMKFRLEFVDLTNIVPDTKALEALDPDVVRRLQISPVADKGHCLVIATSQPTDYSIYEHLRFYTGRKIEMVVATSKQISEAIEQYFPQEESIVEDLIDELVIDQAVENVEEEDEEEESGFSESDSQIVNLVNKVLMDGYAKGASDIHFEPGIREHPFRVRYRIDGVCQLMHQIPVLYKRAIISRLKIMANLDITERRQPQSGKILLKFKNNRVEYRLETTPTTGNNEDAVLRVLASSKPVPLDKMGLSPANEKAFRTMLIQPYGIILCVGPTGSGKTTTLHSALGHLNTPDRKIWTVEDPVEITQLGLRQVQVQDQIGLTFAKVLRSFLRSDPDVIMIGEMRDRETATTAIEASLTGHLVLSTLHTNSAPETIVRLIEMDMDPYNFADALLGIMAQRLARKLCDNCKVPYHPSEEEFAELVRFYDPYWFKEHKIEPYSPKTMLIKKGGCEKCNGTGYRGRLALHELIVGTENIKKAIKNSIPVEEIKVMAMQEGMRTLLMDGVQKVLLGLTDLRNVSKVCVSQTVTL
jgi:type II secretory ATPase GspE/PulE/Tfp pilus assembly ATPase PilB-like protein